MQSHGKRSEFPADGIIATQFFERAQVRPEGIAVRFYVIGMKDGLG